MKKLGFSLIAVGFLAAALVSVLDVEHVKWAFYVPLLVVGFVGVGIVRTAARSHAQASHTVAANIQAIHESLQRVVDNVTGLHRDKHRIDVYDLRGRIDETLVEDLGRFAEARETIAVRHGLQNYADVMTHFAAGERYLNRVWSASADGWQDEAHAYIDKAREQFEEAFSLLKKLEAGKR